MSTGTIRSGARWGMLTLVVAMLASSVNAEAQPPTKMKMTTDIPESITTPDRVETRIGTLEFFDGIPSKETSALVYDYLDFSRAMETVNAGSKPVRKSGRSKTGTRIRKDACTWIWNNGRGCAARYW